MTRQQQGLFTNSSSFVLTDGIEGLVEEHAERREVEDPGGHWPRERRGVEAHEHRRTSDCQQRQQRHLQQQQQRSKLGTNSNATTRHDTTLYQIWTTQQHGVRGRDEASEET